MTIWGQCCPEEKGRTQALFFSMKKKNLQTMTMEATGCTMPTQALSHWLETSDVMKT